MPLRGFRLRMLSLFAATVCLIAIPFAHSQGSQSDAAPAKSAPSLNGPSFIPDGSFRGSTLAGWHTLGKPELVYEAEGYMRYAKPDPANPTGSWIIHTISEKGPWPAHGIGVGDINGDGRMDILGAQGWWEQPPAGSGDQLWKYHPVAFGSWGQAGPGGSEIGVYDVNGDGLNDVVYQPAGARLGLAWFEQKRSKDGEITNPNAPGGAELVPQLVHNRSGVGSDVLAVDLNGDGRMDM